MRRIVTQKDVDRGYFELGRRIATLQMASFELGERMDTLPTARTEPQKEEEQLLAKMPSPGRESALTLADAETSGIVPPHREGSKGTGQR